MKHSEYNQIIKDHPQFKVFLPKPTISFSFLFGMVLFTAFALLSGYGLLASMCGTISGTRPGGWGIMLLFGLFGIWLIMMEEW